MRGSAGNRSLSYGADTGPVFFDRLYHSSYYDIGQIKPFPGGHTLHAWGAPNPPRLPRIALREALEQASCYRYRQKKALSRLLTGL